MTPSQRHKKPSFDSPNWRGQRNITPRYPRHNSSGSDATINQPQHTYIHSRHPHIVIPSHFHKKPRPGSPNKHGQRDIASQDPRRTVMDLTITDTTVKDVYTAVTQVINVNTTNLTIVTNLNKWTTKTQLRLAEVLERAELLQVPQVTDR